jgi:hypothetical protein
MSAKPDPFWVARIAAGQPARLRNPGESTEDYRIAMGWDEPPKGSPAVEKAMDRFYAAGPSRDALENCRLFAARHRKEEWGKTILKFCNEGGATGSPLRAMNPLTRERIHELWVLNGGSLNGNNFEAFARIIEKEVRGAPNA